MCRALFPDRVFPSGQVVLVGISPGFTLGLPRQLISVISICAPAAGRRFGWVDSRPNKLDGQRFTQRGPAVRQDTSGGIGKGRIEALAAGISLADCGLVPVLYILAGQVDSFWRNGHALPPDEGAGRPAS